ncbi:DEAD/DEAH box helicase family protein [Streptomyces sp. NPDC058463]|uniref:DEAD/DEAH box helicase family protein n=1 Tax=Streptomyces sp. NPDC058463 TaxID=3346510 RepID=UPI0036679B17
MAKLVLRSHQREAVDAVLRALEPAPGTRLPARGLRTQVIMATGSGKTLVAAHCADELQAGRILVPSLDLLTQTAQACVTAGAAAPFSVSRRCAVRKRPSRTRRTLTSSSNGPVTWTG